MTHDPHSIELDLKRRVSGEVLFDDISRTLFSTAAGIFQIQPLGVVVPKRVEDVQEVARYCNERGIPITSRGAGTSLAGQSIGSGIVIVFNKYFREILEVNSDEHYASVQPGVVLEDLNKALRRISRQSQQGSSGNNPSFHHPIAPSFPGVSSGEFMFGPDPSSGKQCVIGGMIGTNAAGAHTVKYGSTKDNVLELKIVTADGELLTISPGSKGGRFVGALRDLLLPSADQIRAGFPKTPKNSSGYNLLGAIYGDGVDLTKLLCGSEGTLGITVEAKLDLVPAPTERRDLIAYFPSYESCAVAANESLQFGPAAVEMLDKTFANVALGLDPRIDELLGEDFVSIIIFEFEEQERGAADDKIAKLSEHLSRLRLTSKLIFPRDKEEAAKLWRVRKEASSIFYKIEKPGKKTSFVEDVAVPVNKLSDYLSGAQRIFKENGIQYALYGHAGSGNTHAIVLLDLKDKDHLGKIDPIANDIYNLAISLGGTLSGEHGDGLSRTPFLSRLYGDEIYSIFREVKRIFDPNGILNPGKIIGDQETSIVRNLRYGESYRRVATITGLDEEKIAHEIEKCHGCGACLSYCPTAIATSDERATPRAKGNILRALIDGDLETGYLKKKEFKDVLDYCFNCKLCLTECPTQIDIPGIVVEAKTIFIDNTEKTRQDRFINKLPILSAVSSVAPTMTNITMGVGLLRKQMEKSFGIDRRRQMPFFHKPLHKRFRINRRTGKEQRKAVYFAGCYANFNDVYGEGIATVEVLRRNGVDVRVLDSLRCCGIAKITTGSRKEVIPDATWNVEQLARYVDQGFDIIVSAPSCGLAMMEDYPAILNTPASRKVANHIVELSVYLMRLDADGQLNTDFGPLNKRVTYHSPCHSIPLGVTRQPLELMRMVPGLEVVELGEDTCCGMAGTFGLKTQFYDLSMKVGTSLFRQIKDAKVDSVVTTCGTCNMQIAQGTGIEVQHLSRILHDAYRRFDGKKVTSSPGESEAKETIAAGSNFREIE